ncbi:cysteinyl leukotriene receptor 1-like [Mustelus asterias]
MFSLNFNPNSSNCSSDDFKFPVFTGVYSLILVTGLIGNTLALYVFVRLTRRKTASTVIMVNLALSDLFFNLTLPYRISYYSQREWKLATFLCPVTTYAFYVNLYSSIFFLTALSVSRYLVILHPMWSRRTVTVRKAVWASLGIWMGVGLSCAPFLRVTCTRRGEKYHCFQQPSFMSWGQILRMNYLGLVVGFLFPFLIIVVCYARVVRRLRKTAVGLTKSPRAHCRSVYLVAFVTASFLLCFLPYHLIRTVHLHLMVNNRQCQAVTAVIHVLNVASVCLAAANSCLNPLLYYFAGANFRRNAKLATIFKLRKFSTNQENSSAISLQQAV